MSPEQIAYRLAVEAYAKTPTADLLRAVLHFAPGRGRATGRRCGQRHPRAVLSDQQVDAAIAAHEAGESLRSIAERFKVSKSCIGDICTGRRRGEGASTWRQRDVGLPEHRLHER